MFRRFVLLTVTLVAAALPLRASAQVFGWGAASPPINQPLGRITQLFGGFGHTLALKSDGTVAAWGSNDRGQTIVPTGLTSVVAVSAGGSHSLALKSDGTVVAWGYNNYWQATVPTGHSCLRHHRFGHQWSSSEAVEGDSVHFCAKEGNPEGTVR